MKGAAGEMLMDESLGIDVKYRRRANRRDGELSVQKRDTILSYVISKTKNCGLDTFGGHQVEILSNYDATS